MADLAEKKYVVFSNVPCHPSFSLFTLDSKRLISSFSLLHLSVANIIKYVQRMQ
jgi:hypothetical protein